MYKCDSCGKSIGPRVSRAKYSRVTETRARIYYNPKRVTKYTEEGKPYNVTEVLETTGTEIVKVTNFCPIEAKFFDETHGEQQFN